MIRKWLKKKVKGVSNIIATMVCIMAILLIVAVIMCISGNIHNRNEVERVHRKYLLAMEKDGYLSPANIVLLKQDLESLNCKDIQISGSLAPVGYGGVITLRVECMMKSYKLTFTGTDGHIGEEYVSVIIEKKGTALY